MADKFLLFDLEDSKSKEVATILSNASARKILSYLSENDAAESDLAKALHVPVSTIHYNVQKLLKHDLIVIKDTLYSQKGNKVNIYRAARKAIVLAPRGSSFWSSIKDLIPIVGLAAVGSVLISQFSRVSFPVSESARIAADTLEESAGASADLALPVVESVSSSNPNIALWFFLGALFVALLVLVVRLIRRR